MLIETGRRDRPETPWGQLLQDLFEPSGLSNWNRTVADRRIVMYDRIRPFVTRGLLVGAQAAILALGTRTSLVTWLLMLPAALQVGLEIFLEPRTRLGSLSEAIEGRRAASRFITRFYYENYEKLTINLTGMLGVPAVAGLLLSVLVASGSEDPSWARVAALTTAVLFSISALSNLMLDTPWFSPRQAPVMAPMTWLRPHVWLVALAVLWGGLWLSQRVEPWSDGSLPYAFGVTLLAYYLGLRIRDVDRDMGAATATAVVFEDEERQFLATEMHNKVQWVKTELEEVLASPLLTTSQRVAMSQFIYDIRELHDRSRTRRITSGMLVGTIEERVMAIAREYSIDVALAIHLTSQDLGPDNYRLARELTTTLCYNARQAYERDAMREDFIGRPVTLEVGLSRRDNLLTLTVSDTLPLIEAGQWLAPRSTLEYYAHKLSERDGHLAQRPTDEGGKTIEATWDVRLTPLRKAD